MTRQPFTVTLSQLRRQPACGHPRPHYANGRCSSCYHATYAPATGTGRGGPGVTRGRTVRAGRADDVAELLSQDEDIRMIAQRLGVSVRTVHRYRARLRRTS